MDSNTRVIIRQLLIGLTLVLSVLATIKVIAEEGGMSKDTLSANVDTKGQISLPKDFRNTMAHLGSWFVPEGDASGFHDVYVDRKSVDYYRANGSFPDGATLVKELRAASTGDYTTGSGVSYANKQIKQWFVMVKDKENRFAGDGVWGEGWGWALFKTDDKSKNVVSDYKVDCIGCHVPAKETDWIYTEAYPTLLSQ